MYENNDLFNRLAVGIVALTLFFNPVLHCIKLLRMGNTVGAVFFYVTFPLIAIFFGMSLIFGRNLKILRPNFLEIVILTMILWGTVVTLLYAGDAMDVTANLLRMCFSLACYHTTRVYALNLAEQGIDSRLAKYGLAGTFFAVLILYLLGVFGPFPVYLGLGTSSAFIALAYVLVKEPRWKWLYAVFIVILIILGGKRGHMLSAFAMIFLSFFVSKRMVVPLIILGIMSLFSIYALSKVDIEKVVSALPKPVAARLIAFVATPDAEETGRTKYDQMTSGRMFEVLAVMSTWKSEPSSMYTGKGFGAAFINQAGDADSTVHISPVALSFIYGVPLASLFMLTVILIVFKNLTSSKSTSANRRLWALSVVGYLVSTLSLYTIFQDPMLWISLGMISNKDL
ncbi:MAG: hypothetical protein AB7E48_05180 [Deferribacterales bacterium]